MDLGNGQVVLEEAYDEKYEPTEEGERAHARIPGKRRRIASFLRDSAVLRGDWTRPEHRGRPDVLSQRRNKGSTTARLETSVSNYDFTVQPMQ